ncbi:hypothetical protein ACM01_20195 [Streptomyces viridochromogenes]|uniref:Uncharacterized protein n=1 Tax=Streptomyces viridochromogenes TaxID=1938 RepID=A0A0J7ZAN1_STRVR|nr:hypothetical protein [Streptomyces viridochromogenes]KMS73141.1 hypothetical protein ACM01_20195 [Streptomyces viridochromogenes]
MESFGDLIAADDVLLFVNAAITATGQREFHSDAGAQRLSLDFLHAYMLGNYRDLYAGVLALDINDHNAALIIRRLLETAAEATVEQRRSEGRLIAGRLAVLPPQRVYGLFGALRRAGVNNRRTRALLRDWLSARPDLAFDAVKYRSGLKQALRHAHLVPGDGEIGTFLFAPLSRARYDIPILETWRRAHFEQAAVFELPYTVAEGFAAQHGIPRKVFLERIAPRLTRGEALRLQEAAQARGPAAAEAVKTDLSRMPLTRLAGYVLSLPAEERVVRRAELDGALRTAAQRVAGAHRGTWGRVTAVLDDSFSSYGSGVKRRRPLAVALACHYLLGVLAGHYRGLWTSGRGDALLAHPVGPTPLGERVLDGLETSPDRLVIVSDGWDNAPPGLAAEVLRVWRTRLDTERRTSVVHLNPVYDAADFDVRRLSARVPTAGIRDAEDLPALVEIAQFAEGRTGLAELTAYLDARAARLATVQAQRVQGADGATGTDGSSR